LFSDPHKTHKYSVWQNVELLDVKLVVHIVTTGLLRVKSVIKTSQLMPYREIIAVCSQIHTKHINMLWAEHRISVR